MDKEYWHKNINKYYIQIGMCYTANSLKKGVEVSTYGSERFLED